MNVRVQGQRTPPGVQRKDEPWLGPQVSFVLEQFHQGIAYRSKQQLSQGGGIETPQRVKFMRNGEDKVAVSTLYQAPLLGQQPAFDLNLIALGTVAVFTRVVPHSVEVTIFTDSDMAAKLGGATVN